MPSPLARHWQLDPSITFLNHGSFGACPTAVLEAQRAWRDRMEAEPIRFLARDLDTELTRAREALGAFVGADPDDVAFVSNATTAANTVLRSLRFEAGDEILSTDHEYNAILNVARHVAARDGARVVIAALPFPAASPDELAEPILAAVTDRTKLAVISQATSPTALVLPIERIVRALAERGVDTLVDGAHAPGMLPLDVDSIGAAYYAGNLHKWVCAPKGSGFLHVRRDRQSAIRPATISHGANAPDRGRSRFRLEFDWQGTLDPTAWLSVPAAIDYVGGLVDGGWLAIMERNHALAVRGRDLLAAALRPHGGGAASSDELLGSMAALTMPPEGPLGGAALAEQSSPLDTDLLQARIYEEFRVEAPIVGWPVPAAERPGRSTRTIRIAMALHNDIDDVEHLADALAAIAATG